MPLCILCQTRFYDQSYTEPADPCDCTQCVSAEAAEQMSAEELAAARAAADAELEFGAS